MKTYSLNALAEDFEVDRGTMVKALRNVPSDSEITPGRPTWKISTAGRALEAHRRRTGNGLADSSSPDFNPIDPKLQSLYSQLDAADATMRTLPTLIERRAFAVKSLRPIIDATQRMQLIVGSANKQDPEVTGLFSDKLYMLSLRGLETPCGWTQSETWDAMSVGED
jgi:hypothetical protein